MGAGGFANSGSHNTMGGGFMNTGNKPSKNFSFVSYFLHLDPIFYHSFISFNKATFSFSDLLSVLFLSGVALRVKNETFGSNQESEVAGFFVFSQ